jgi:hypothetical protein
MSEDWQPLASRLSMFSEPEPRMSFTLDDQRVRTRHECKVIVLAVTEKQGVWRLRPDMWTVTLRCLLVRRDLDRYERVGSGFISFVTLNRLRVEEDGTGHIEGISFSAEQLVTH